jgi:hypothetical protein
MVAWATGVPAFFTASKRELFVPEVVAIAVTAVDAVAVIITPSTISLVRVTACPLEDDGTTLDV